MWVPVPLPVMVAGPPSSRLGMSASNVIGTIPEHYLADALHCFLPWS